MLLYVFSKMRFRISFDRACFCSLLFFFWFLLLWMFTYCRFIRTFLYVLFYVKRNVKTVYWTLYKLKIYTKYTKYTNRLVSTTAKKKFALRIFASEFPHDLEFAKTNSLNCKMKFYRTESKRDVHASVYVETKENGRRYKRFGMPILRNSYN